MTVHVSLRHLIAGSLLVALPGSSATGQSFARRETPQRFNQVKRILAVVDINRDGRDNLIVGGQPNDGSETIADRLAKLPVRVVLGTRAGHFRLAPASTGPVVARAVVHENRVALVEDQWAAVPDLCPPTSTVTA